MLHNSFVKGLPVFGKYVLLWQKKRATVKTIALHLF
jgi:hypothetical protein